VVGFDVIVIVIVVIDGLDIIELCDGAKLFFLRRWTW